MRVSTSMQYSLSNGTVARRRVELIKAQEALATGNKINSLGIDPVGGRRILREESSLREIETHRRVGHEAELMLQQADATLADVGGALQRVLEIVIRLGSDSFSTLDRESGAHELKEIRARMLELANVERHGRYLFSGIHNAGPPFAQDGAFLGDTQSLQMPVGRGATVGATLPGGEPFVDSTTGTSLFRLLDSIEAALRSDDGTAIRASISSVRDQIDKNSSSRQEIGHRLGRIENVLTALDRAELTANATLQAEKDTDYTEAVLQLQESEAGMRSALLVTARLNELNLTNFL